MLKKIFTLVTTVAAAVSFAGTAYFSELRPQIAKVKHLSEEDFALGDKLLKEIQALAKSMRTNSQNVDFFTQYNESESSRQIVFKNFPRIPYPHGMRVLFCKDPPNKEEKMNAKATNTLTIRQSGGKMPYNYTFFGATIHITKKRRILWISSG